MERDVRNLSIEELRKLTQANCCEHDTFNRIARVYSIYVTKLFLKIGISANKISFLFMISMGITGMFLFLAVGFRNWIYYLPALFFFLLYMVLDNSDGEVARATNTANPLTGKVMEGLCHGTGDCLVLISLIFGLYYRLESVVPLYIGFILFFGKYVEDHLGERIIRSVRLYEARNLNVVSRKEMFEDEEEKKGDTGVTKKIIKSVTTFFPDNGLFLFVFISFFHDRVLLIYFLLWSIAFHIRWMIKITKHLKSSSKYLQRG